MFPVRWVRHDYYGALNVTRAANATEIAKKYRRLALQYHPDKLVRLPKHEHKKAELLFKEIAEAKEVLSDPETRAAYDETIDGLPRFARPKYGSRSIFDKERLKIGPFAVLLGCFVVVVVFVTLNQRANQISDKASIKRSEYYQRWLKRARKGAKEDRYKHRDARLTKDADDEYFQWFLVDERIVFREGWEHTLLGRWARRLRGKGEPPLTKTEEALKAISIVARLEAESRKAEAENAAEKNANPAKPRAAKGGHNHNAKARKKNR
jgi:curved DNA-binding protein CbpA